MLGVKLVERVELRVFQRRAAVMATSTNLSGATSCLNRRRLPTSTALWCRRATLSLCLSVVFLWGRCHAGRQMKERVQLAKQTGEANPRVDHVEFDPLVAELEQEQDDQAWLENYRRTRDMWTQGAEEDGDYVVEGEGAAFEAMEEFLEHEAEEEDLQELGEGNPADFLEEGLFNISDRIIKLFPLIDASPSDGRISLDEMTAWHLRIAEQGSVHRTLRELKASDANGDQQATLQEALVSVGMGDPDDETIQDQRESYIRRFHLADVNKDDVLNVTEFHDFLHPEESSNDALLQALIQDEMRQRDLDSDGKLNLQEFEMTTHHEVAHLMSESPDLEMVALEAFHRFEQDEDSEEAKRSKEEKLHGSFQSFDSNKDGYIDKEEFRPIMKALWPSQRDFAVIHSKDITKQADGDGDGSLTLQEMLNHPHAFYQTVDDQDQPVLHDEF